MSDKNHIAEKKILNATVSSNRRIGKDVYSMSLNAPSVAGMIRPGQFINVYLKDRSRLLPRPLSISSVEGKNLILTYAVLGKGTLELSKYKKEAEVKISTSLGNGFDLNIPGNCENIVILGGGIGVAPLLYLARTLRNNTPETIVTAILGDRELPVLINEFSSVCRNVYLASENLPPDVSKHINNIDRGTVMDIISKRDITGDYIFACGPKAMLKAVSRYAEEKDIPSQISLDERMGCGFGACVGCSVKIKHNGRIIQKKVCTDGPIFKGNEVIWND